MEKNYVLNKFDTWFLLLLPSFIILIDLSSWTGRIVFNEFDLLVAPFAFYLGIKGLLTGKIAKRYLLLGALLLGSLLVNVNFASLYTDITEPLYTNIYYSQAYAFKIVKGFCYGFLLAIHLASYEKTQIHELISTLIKGAVLGSFVLFLVILWERGFLYKLLSFENVWGIAASFLNFSTSYRVTALSSDMHTGGEAYDGILLYLMPLTFLGIQYFNDKRLKLISLLAIFSLGYCVMVGFTRASYFAVALSIIYLVISQLKLTKAKLDIKIILGFIGLASGSILLFISKGYSGLIAIYIIILLFYFLPDFLQRLSVPFDRPITAIVALIASVFIVVTAQSKWAATESSSIVSIIYCFLIVSACATQSILRGYSQPMFNKLYSLVGELGVISILCILFTGYQFNARMETVTNDLKTRVDHWLKVAESSEGTTASFIFGNGVGSLPINYLTTHPDVVEQVGTFTIRDNALILSRGQDLTFGQRVNIEPHTDYQIKINVNGYKPERISAAICERNAIYSSNFSPNCIGGLINLDENTGSYILTANSGKLGGGGLSFFRWPTTFVLKNRYGTDPIKVDSIELTNISSSQTNYNLLNNANFEQGMDHWYFYNDFEHLPFHIKNIYLGFFYQVGLIGLFIVLLVIIKVIATTAQSMSHKIIQRIVIAYLIGMFSFGFFGDPLDSARANILFSLLVFTGLFILSRVPLNKTKIYWSISTFALLIIVTVVGLSLPALYSPFKQFKQFSLKNSALGGDALTIYKKPMDLGDVGASTDLAVFSAPVNEVVVSNENEFYQALKTVEPGEHIVLSAGIYRFSRRSPKIRRSGTMSQPITIRARELEDVIFEMDLVEGLLIMGSHLHIRNIVFRGIKGSDAKIEHAMHIVGNADFVTIENNQFVNFNSHIKSNGYPNKSNGIDFPDRLKIINNDFFNEWPRKTKSPTTPIDIVGGDNTLIKNNFIADFAKAKKDGYWMATGAFLKGGGKRGVFDNNVVMCEWKIPHASPREVRIGLSFGNGGTGPQFCADKKCEYEHVDGVMRNNTILNCINDVGIYLNKSKNTLIENNAVRSSLGIDVRFEESSAEIRGNVIEGRVKTRDGATISLDSNIIE